MPTAAATRNVTASDHDVLLDLNRNYIRSVQDADVAWFDANLSDDFLNSNPDGTLIDRAAFLAQIGKKTPLKNIREEDVHIVMRGVFAFIHARTTYQKPDGTQGAGRYTDIWWRRDDRWLCVTAHVTRA